MSMENLDKDADYHKNKPYLLYRFMKSLKKYVPEECSCFEITNKAYFCGNRILLSTFFILISSEGRKCDFFVRHNGVLSEFVTMSFRQDIRPTVALLYGQARPDGEPRRHFYSQWVNVSCILLQCLVLCRPCLVISESLRISRRWLASTA